VGIKSPVQAGGAGLVLDVAFVKLIYFKF